MRQTSPLTVWMPREVLDAFRDKVRRERGPLRLPHGTNGDSAAPELVRSWIKDYLGA
jgi:hypothetical protein